MESELQEAIDQYRSALSELEGLEGVEEMKAELASALESAEEALKSLAEAGGEGEGAEEPEPEQEAEEPPAKKARTEEGAGPSGSSIKMLCHLPAEPDFALLATKYPSLAPFLIHDPRGKARPTVDFKNSDGSRELTRVLMKEYFNVEWSVPVGQLVPPVPNRTNYIKWIAQLLAIARPPGDKVTGLDVGCGANLIYPLIGSSMFGWDFIGVDAAQVAVDSARSILSKNPHLAGKIQVRKVQAPPGVSGGSLEGAVEGATPVEAGGVLSPAILPEDPVLAFTMCNPPFFGSIEKAGLNPNTNHEGTAEEMVCPGGEEAFILRMVEDSSKMKDKVYWFSTMVGKKSTLKQTRYQLQQRNVEVIRTTELQQGKTVRWCIAWSYVVPRERGLQQLSELEVPREQTHEAAGTPGKPAQGVASTASLLGSRGVSLKGIVPRASASVMIRERNGRSDTVFNAFVARMRGFGCEGETDGFSGVFKCSALPDDLGLIPTTVHCEMRQQDKSTFIFELKVAQEQKSGQQHLKRLGWLSSSLSVVEQRK